MLWKGDVQQWTDIGDSREYVVYTMRRKALKLDEIQTGQLL